MSGVYALDGVTPELPKSGDYWIAPGAQVVGNVTLLGGASVWFNAVIRGDNEKILIGSGSNVQDGCVLHTDLGFPLTIGAQCTIGHQATLHGCSIGDGALIGMGATVLNGARIGSGALVAAGALVPEGNEIPAGALVMGAPCKTVRILDAATQRGLIASAEGYQANMRRFRTGLKTI